MLPHVLPLEMNFIIHAYSVRRVYVYIREGEEAMESKIQEEGKMSFSPKTPDSEAITTMFSTILLYFLIYSFSPNDAIGQFEK